MDEVAYREITVGKRSDAAGLHFLIDHGPGAIGFERVQPPFFFCAVHAPEIVVVGKIERSVHPRGAFGAMETRLAESAVKHKFRMSVGRNDRLVFPYAVIESKCVFRAAGGDGLHKFTSFLSGNDTMICTVCKIDEIASFHRDSRVADGFFHAAIEDYEYFFSGCLDPWNLLAGSQAHEADLAAFSLDDFGVGAFFRLAELEFII